MKNKNQIDIPLLFFFCAFCIVILGLFSKLTTPIKGGSELKKESISVQVAPHKKTTQRLDYNKPIVCTYKSPEASISASLEGNSLEASILNDKITQRYIVQGDCMYSWVSTETRGTKKCGVGGYIPMGKQLLNSGFGSMESFAQMFQKSSKKSLMIDFKAVFESCTNVKEIKKEVFAIPSQIYFVK